MGDTTDAGPGRVEQTETLTAWAARLVGPVELVADRSQRHGRALVLELAGPAGRWFAKRPKDMHSFRRELNAYREYVPRVTAPAPRLVATSVVHKALLITALPGRTADEDDLRDSPDVHRMAGAWLAELHGAAAPVPAQDLGAELRQRLVRLLAKSWHELDRQTVDYLSRVGERLAEMPPLLLVPCHFDFTQRNWVLCADGRLGVIDFSGCDLGMVAEDFSRLANREWTQNPDLRDAFLEGYGRELDELELDQVECCTALAALSALTRGTGTGNRAILAPSIRTLRELAKPAFVAPVAGPRLPAPARQVVSPAGAERHATRERSGAPRSPRSALAVLTRRMMGRFQRSTPGRDGS